MKRTKLLVGISVFWLGLALLMDGLNSIILPTQLIESGASRPATALGLVTFAGLLAALVLQPIAGEWSDWLRGAWGRTGSIALALLGVLAGLFALGVGRNLVSLFVAYLVIQIAASLGRAALSAFIPDLLPYDKTGRAATVQEGLRATGSALGFLVLGSFVAAAALSSALMVVGAVLTLAFLVMVLLVGERPRLHGVRHSTPTWDDLYRFDFRTHRRYAWLVLSRGLFLTGIFAVSRFLLLFLVDRFGLDASAAAERSGLLLSGMFLVIALFAPLAVSLAQRAGHGSVMGAGAAAAGAGIAAVAFGGATDGDTMPYVLAGMLSAAFGSSAFLAANSDLAAELIPAVHAIKFNGLANLAVLAAAALAGLFGPLLDWAERIGDGRGYVALFTAATAAFVMGALAARHGLVQRPTIGETVTESSRL